MWILWKGDAKSTEVSHKCGKLFSNFNKAEKEFNNANYAGQFLKSCKKELKTGKDTGNAMKTKYESQIAQRADTRGKGFHRLCSTG